MSGTPGAVSAMTLFVQDLAASKDFYGRAFGLPIVFEDADSVVYRFGDAFVNLLHVSATPELIEPALAAPAGAGASAVFTITVDDVDATCAALIANGVTILNGPVDRPWGPRTVSVADPSGHIWEFAT